MDNYINYDKNNNYEKLQKIQRKKLQKINIKLL